jgi:GDP-4-dehydro-6-deoxy-D-mannose reductase
MRCLVTGASGFIGSYLVEFLATAKHEVTGLGRTRSLALNAISSDFSFIEGDLLHSEGVGKLLDSVRPDVIFHLAAQSYPRVSWKQPARTFEVNVVGTIYLFEEILARKLDPTIVVLCSSSEYGPSRDDQPITEQGELLPSSPYAVSKLAQDYLSRVYYDFHRLRVVRCRPFFLIGPRKTEDVSSDFARGIVAIEQGKQHDLPVGNLDVVRDFLDVRDGVDAIWLLSQLGRPGDVYNICSGRGYSLRDVLSVYRNLARVDIRERVDPSRIRLNDEMVRIGDPTQLCALGWSPRRPIRQTLADILAYWRVQEADSPRGGQGQELVASRSATTD